MKRVIIASTESAREKYAAYLQDGTVFDANDLKNAMDAFEEATADIEDLDEDTFYELSYDNPDIDVAATVQVILSACGKDLSDVKKFEVGPDGDFDAITFKDGTVKYYFDRGVAGQGIKDAETGELYFF